MHATIIKQRKPPLVKKVEKQAGHDRLALLGDAGRGPPTISTDINEHSDKSELQKVEKRFDFTVKHNEFKEADILYKKNEKNTLSQME